MIVDPRFASTNETVPTPLIEGKKHTYVFERSESCWKKTLAQPTSGPLERAALLQIGGGQLHALRVGALHEDVRTASPCGQNLLGGGSET